MDIIMALDINHYIRRYDGFFPNDYCDHVIEKYEKVWTEEQDKIRELSLCAGCTQCSCNRIDIMQHESFNEDRMAIAQMFNKAVPMYKHDTLIQPYQLPAKYGFENVKIKKYTVGTEQQFKDHVDVADYASAKRFLIFMVYLNDDFEGGETVFNLSGLTVKPKQGTLLMFPPFWTYLHHARKVISGNSKYFVGSYLHYL